MQNKTNVSCIEIAEKLGIKKGKGKNSYYCFNKIKHKNGDEKPSLVIYEDYWECFGCKIKGNNIELVKQYCEMENQPLSNVYDELEKLIPGSTNQITLKKDNKIQFCCLNKKDFIFIDLNNVKDKLRKPTKQDTNNLKTHRNKTISLDTFNIAEVKFIDNYGDYGTMFYLGKTIINNNHETDLYLEGITDFLTAIEMKLHETYNLIFRFNSTKNIKTNLNKKSYFILDHDDSIENITSQILNIDEKSMTKKGKNNTIKFIKINLPDDIKNIDNKTRKTFDLSDYFNICNGKAADIMEMFENTEEYINKNIKFWTKNDNDKIIIQDIKYLNFLESNGFYRCNYSGNIKDQEYIKLTGKLIEEIPITYISTFVRNYLEHKNSEHIEVLNILLKGSKHYFNQLLKSLTFKDIEPKDVMRDTKTEAYFYFKNGFTVTTKKGTVLKPYNKLPKYLWKYNNSSESKDNIIDFNYVNKYIPGFENQFDVFLQNICGKIDNKPMNKEVIKKYKQLKLIVGYLLTNYKDRSQAKLINLIDEKGGTGKNVFFQAIFNMVNKLNIDCKTTKFNNNDFEYDGYCNKTAKCIILYNDWKKDNLFELLYNAITDLLKVKIKFRNSITIDFKYSPKLAMTSNHHLHSQKDSEIRRLTEFIFSDHYNTKHQPCDDFNGNLFDDWENKELWNNFYVFMHECLMNYMIIGKLPDTYDEVIKIKKLIARVEHTTDKDTANHIILYFENNIKFNENIKKDDFIQKCKTNIELQMKLHKNLNTTKIMKWFKEYIDIKNYIFKDRTGKLKDHFMIPMENVIPGDIKKDNDNNIVEFTTAENK